MSEQLNCRELLHSEMCVGDRSILCFFLLAFRFIVAVLPFLFRRFVVYRLSPKSAFRHSAVAILLGIFIILCQHIALSLRLHHPEKCSEMYFGEMQRRKPCNTQRVGWCQWENGSAGCGDAISGGSSDDVFIFSYQHGSPLKEKGEIGGKDKRKEMCSDR